MQTRLRDRWMGLWSSLGHTGDPAALFEDLASRYSEPHRAYHTLAHLEHCFRELDAVLEDVDGVTASNRTAVEFALWYHDVIYDTRAKDNEEQSALYADRVLSRAMCIAANPQLVASYIAVTAHNSEPKFRDEQIVLDVDLAILGQSPALFDEYEQQIRKEYEWVPEEAFRTRRSRILQGFLDRPRIYNLKYFQDKYEAQARENLKRSIGALA